MQCQQFKKNWATWKQVIRHMIMYKDITFNMCCVEPQRTHVTRMCIHLKKRPILENCYLLTLARNGFKMPGGTLLPIPSQIVFIYCAISIWGRQ